MEIRVRSSKSKLPSILPQLRQTPLSFPENAVFPERTMRTQVTAERCDLLHCDLDWFFHYNIFPRDLLRFHGEWQATGREMQPGDVIAQEARVPPGTLSLKLLFGVRVLAVYRSATAAGFRYGTLVGHPEAGTNEFSLSVSDDGVLATIRTRATLGLLSTRLLAFVVKPYVAFSNGEALRGMKTEFLRHNSALRRE